MALENVTWTIRASQIAEFLSISAKNEGGGKENAILADVVRNAQEKQQK